MTDLVVVSIAREAVLTILLVAGPALGIGMLVGLLVSIFQATTQIQEQTLTFIPKIVAVLVSIVIFGPWMIRRLVDFAERLLGELPTFIMNGEAAKLISVADFVRFSLSFIRLTTFFSAAPLFSMRSVPIAAKVGLSAFCALIALPELDPAWDLGSWHVLALLAAQEVAVGLLLALMVILVFAVVTFAGHFVDVPLGFGMASVFDPSLGGQVPVFSQFYHIVAA